MCFHPTRDGSACDALSTYAEHVPNRALLIFAVIWRRWDRDFGRRVALVAAGRPVERARHLGFGRTGTSTEHLAQVCHEDDQHKHSRRQTLKVQRDEIAAFEGGGLEPDHQPRQQKELEGTSEEPPRRNHHICSRDAARNHSRGGGGRTPERTGGSAPPDKAPCRAFARSRVAVSASRASSRPA